MAESEETYPDDLRVVVLSRESRDAAAIPRVLEGIGATAVMCRSPEEVGAEIEKGAGALLAEEETLTLFTRELIASKLDRQPPWSELPVIVLLRHGTETQLARDALLMRWDVSLVERPVRVNTLASLVRSALRSRRRQYLMRDQLRALDKSETELRKAKEDLELRVEERTQELTQALEKLRTETEERLRVAQELTFKDQLLMQQSRMAAMGEMIGFIAHQWRQPLNSLGLISQELSFRYKRGAFDEQYVDEVTAQTMRIIKQMSQTIDDFRHFFKSESEKRTFRMMDSVTTTLKLVEASFREHNLEVEVIANDDVVVEGFPNQFSQVLLNILMNARDACVERKVEKPKIWIHLLMEDGKAVMTITDNAGGVPEETIARIFDPYFTTKGPERGTGVGLYMAKTIVERNMGGRLTVSNTPEGAEFRIQFETPMPAGEA
jgi:C4-dicarboxylate-specific signal transduction histidine kinase